MSNPLPWFPFHPVGYAVSSSWSLSLLWLPLLIAWIIKSVLLRYGGLRAYRQAMPFFAPVTHLAARELSRPFFVYSGPATSFLFGPNR